MLPQVFLERMQGLLGSEYEEFLVSFDHEKYQALRLNPLKLRTESGRTDDSTVIEEKIQQTFRLHPVPWADNGYYYTKEDQPGKHPWHEAGLYYIQEPSAMAPVTLLSPQPGERILDLCAAPGGKSTQIASAMEGEGLLVTNEIHPARAKILSENVERMGIRNACVLNETPEHLADIFEEYFDRILVDAPCSGEGMFRKNEVACEEWSPENVQLCADRQDGILECAARMLVPGGRLVYSTCTFAPAENEGSISRFLAMHEEFEIVSIDKKHWGSRRAVTVFRAVWRTRRRVSKAPCACGLISYVARGIMPQYYRKGRASGRLSAGECHRTREGNSGEESDKGLGRVF